MKWLKCCLKPTPHCRYLINSRRTFGQDGSIMVIGVKDDQLYELKNFKEWYQLSKRLKEVEGIDKVVSMANVYGLEKDKVNKRLVPYPVIAREPQSQIEP